MRKDKPSNTACKVALNIVALSTKPGMDKVLPPDTIDSTAALLLASGAVSARVLRWLRSRKMSPVYAAFNLVLPGQFEAFGYRKAFCERQVRDGIDAGATQVLVLGAGYDTMGWRLAPQFSGVNFFEIDFPATARRKAKGIEAMGQRDNLCLVSADLCQRRLIDIMQARARWEQTARSVIVAEGLLMYLPPSTVKDLFRQSAEIVGRGSRIAFTYLSTRQDGLPDAGRWTKFILLVLTMTGEPWLWSIRPKEIGRWLAGTGWTNATDPPGSRNRLGVEFLGVAVR